MSDAVGATAADTLLALDFAGTLSVDTIDFARSDRLTAALRASGLAALGVGTPEVFWSRVIAPTWDRGSTTDAGYATVVAEATADLRRARGRPADPGRVRTAAADFTARYLASSTIAAPWWPALRRFAARGSTAVVVATDHYAELTAHLLTMLDGAGLRATAATRPTRVVADGRITVANSADVGCHKVDPSFWHRVHGAVGQRCTTALLVDDFGANERPGGAYGDPAAVRRRRDRTVAAVAAALAVAPRVHGFGPADRDEASIRDAVQWVDAQLVRS